MLSPSDLKSLSDQDLTKGLHALAADLRTTESQLLLYLIETDERRLYAQAGHSSLFDFCTRQLKFSEGTTCRRLAAAKVVRQ